MFTRRSKSKTNRSLRKNFTKKHPAQKISAQNPALQLEALERRLLLDADITVTALGGPWPAGPITSGDLLYTDVLADDPMMEQSFQIMNDSEPGSGTLYIYWLEMYDAFSIQFQNPEEPLDDYVLEPGETAEFVVQLDTSTLDIHTGNVSIYNSVGTEVPFEFTLEAFVNAEPTANAGGDRTVNEGEVVTFSGAYDDPNVREFDPLTFEWDFDDGSPAVSTQNATHVFADEGLYEVDFTVTDDYEGTHTHSIDVTVLNVAPTVDAGGPYTFDEGDTTVDLELNGSATDPGADDIMNYAWDLDNDGIFGEAPYEPSGTAPGANWTDEVEWSDLAALGLPSDGTALTIWLRADDGEGGAGYGWTTLTINNLDPDADAGGPYTINEGQDLDGLNILDASGSYDRDDRDALTFSWDLDNDGDYEFTAEPNDTLSVPWSTLKALGITTNSTIGLRVDDGQGGYDTDTAALTINNLNPEADAGGSYTINEGEDLLLNGSGSGDPGNDSLNYNWTINGTSVPGSDEIVLVPWSFLEGLGANDHDTLSISLTVMDEQEGDDTDDTTLTIINVLPTADAGGAYTINEGEALGLDASGTNDPNANDELTYEWYLDGDDVPDAQGVNPLVTWADLELLDLTSDGGPFPIRLKVTDSRIEVGAGSGDNDVDYVTDTAWLAINNLAATVNAGGPYDIDEGDTGSLELNGSATDPDGNDQPNLTYAWDLNNDGDFGNDPEPEMATADIYWDDLVALGLPSDGTALTIWLRVDDGQGGVGYAHTTLTINNLDPIADAGGNDVILVGGEVEVPIYRINEGEELPLDAIGYNNVVDVATLSEPSGTMDPDWRDVLTFSWDLDGDGDYEITAHPTGDYTVPWSTLEALGLASDGSLASTVGLRVEDGQGGVGYAYVDLYIDNLDPYADPGGIDLEVESPFYVIIEEGEHLLLDGSGCTDPGNDPLTFYWTIGDIPFFDTEVFVLVPWSVLEMAGVQGLDEDFEEFLITLEVSDGQGGSDIAKAELMVINVAPTVDAGGAYTIDEGEALGLDASGTTDPNANDDLTFAWDLDDDGAYDDAFGVNPIVSWAKLENLGLTSDGGPFPISLKVNDDVDYGADTTWLAINNLAAAVDAGGPYDFDEGDTDTLQLNGSATDPDGNDGLTFAWDLNNDGIFGGANEPTGPTPNVTTWADLAALGLPSDGTALAIGLRVDDGEGGVGFAHTTLTINNLDPVPVTGDYTIFEGDALYLNASASTDPDFRDVPNLTFAWDLDGDGDYEFTADPAGVHTVPWSTLEALGLASDGSELNIGLRVDDGQGGVGAATTTLTINNLAPFADADGPYIINEGQFLILDATAAFDLDANDALSYAWDLDGDGDYDDATGINPLVRWETLEALGLASDGSELTIGLRVDDGQPNGVDTATAMLYINNVAPTADAGGPYTILEGSSVTLNAGDTSDPDANDVLSYAWDLDNDGDYDDAVGVNPTVSWATLEALGLPTNGSAITIGVLVTDSDGDDDTDASALMINNVAPSVDAGPDDYNLMGTVAVFDGSFFDPAGILDTHTFLWDFGDGITAETLDAAHIYTYSGLYTVSLTVTDSDGAQTTDVLEITVEEQIPVINGQAIYHNLSGLVIVTLTGPGDLELYHINGLGIDFSRVVLTDTTEESQLKFKTVGEYSYIDGGDFSTVSRYTNVVIGDVTVNSSLGKLLGKKAVLKGDIIVNTGSLGYLKLDDIADDSTIQTAAAAPKGFRLKAHDIGEGVDFNIADKITKFQADEYAGGYLTADSINKLIMKKGSLGADVATREGGGIGKVKVYGDIEGAVESATSIKRVSSETGGLTGDAAIIAHEGSIGKAKFAADVEGVVLASENIGKVSSLEGALSGTLRAGEMIGKVRFNNIDSALVSSGGNVSMVYSYNSIVDTVLLAGFDIGPDGLPGTGDEMFNPDSAAIGKIRVNPKTGDFFGSQALSGVKPFDYDPITESWTMLAPAGQTQQLASFGKIGRSVVGQVFLNGDPDIGIYGLFAATEVGKVKLTEIAGAGAPDFEVRQTW